MELFLIAKAAVPSMKSMLTSVGHLTYIQLHLFQWIVIEKDYKYITQMETKLTLKMTNAEK